MTKTKKSNQKTIDAAQSNSEAGLTLTLNAETMKKLKERVSVESNTAVYGLVADALNSYIQLGELSASGVKMFAGNEKGENLRRIRLPFEHSEAV